MTADLPAWLDRQAWPWTSRSLTLPEGAQHYVDEGRGDPVLLVHGTPTWSFEWRHLIRALAAAHRVVACDHLGFGLSSRPAGADYAPEGHARRFRTVIDRLLPEGRLTLVVHDFGGPIALDWALDHPSRLRHLVVINSWMWPFDDDAAMRRKAAMAGGALARFLYRRLNASLRLIMPSAYGDRRRLTPAIHRQYLAPFPDADSRERVLFTLARSLLGSTPFYRALWDRRARLAGVPVTIVWGMRDSALPPAMLERWSAALPHARVVRIAEAGHWPHEEAPAAVVAALAAGVA